MEIYRGHDEHDPERNQKPKAINRLTLAKKRLRQPTTVNGYHS